MKLLSAAALSAGVVALSGCRTETIEHAETGLEPVSIVGQAIAAQPIMQAQPLPEECGCTAGNAKAPPDMTDVM